MTLKTGSLNRGALQITWDDGTPTMIPFQYNPASLKRGLQPQMVGGEVGSRSEIIRYTGAPVETIQVTARLDATDKLAKLGKDQSNYYGIYPDLYALEILLYPSSKEVTNNQNAIQSGAMQIAPAKSPSVLFIWGKNLAAPVVIESYSVSEEAFDNFLNPIQASVQLSMRVLSFTDISTDDPGYHTYMSYLSFKRKMATQYKPPPEVIYAFPNDTYDSGGSK